MGAPIHQNCPFAWVIWTPYLTHDSLCQCEPKSKRHIDRFSRFAQMIAEYPYTLQWFAGFPVKIVPSYGVPGDLDPM